MSEGALSAEVLRYHNGLEACAGRVPRGNLGYEMWVTSDREKKT
jgi:hypothetical protein